MEEELRRWRDGDTVSPEEQLELDPRLRASVDTTYRNLPSVESDVTIRNSERDSQVFEAGNNQTLTNGEDNKDHEMHINKLNYKIAQLEEELESWRSGLEVPPEDQINFDSDVGEFDPFNNEEKIHESNTLDTLEPSQTPRKEKVASNGVLIKNKNEKSKAKKKSVTINMSQPINSTESPRQHQDGDSGHIEILTKSNKAQKKKIHELNNTISELENELQVLRSGSDLPVHERIDFGLDASQEANYVHDTLREVGVQGLGILKDWAVSLVTGLMAGVNKLATCIASATHSQQSQGYNTFAN